ncbi:hypothetical protein [Fangia hongkongensis]|uniref:hypothetical protein n=1 Tax=Fangia hongkongensis TaxID=270495 RepID=UPI000376491F|nr:hypothetical protein [Fangia hongkongensis]MBK2124687.1 hypothetical protein [Fangia hongkongensis]
MAVSNEKLFLIIKEEILAAIDMYKVHHQIATSKSIDNFTGYKINFSSHGNSGIRRAYNLKSFIETLGHSVSVEQVLKKIDEVLEEKSGEKLFSLKTILLCYLSYALVTVASKHKIDMGNITLKNLKNQNLPCLSLNEPLFFQHQIKSIQLNGMFTKHADRNVALKLNFNLKKISFMYSFSAIVGRLLEQSGSQQNRGNIELNDISGLHYWSSCRLNEVESRRATREMLQRYDADEIKLILPNLKLTAMVMSDIGDIRANGCYQEIIAHIKGLGNENQGAKDETAKRISRIIDFCDAIISCVKIYLERQKLSPNLFPYIAGVDIYLKYGLNDPFSATKLASGLLASAANPQFSQDFKLLKLSGAMYYGDALRGDGHTNLGLLRAYDVLFFADTIKRYALTISFNYDNFPNFESQIREFIDGLFVFLMNSGKKETSLTQYLAMGLAGFISHYSKLDGYQLDNVFLQENNGSLQRFASELFQKNENVKHRLLLLLLLEIYLDAYEG